MDLPTTPAFAPINGTHLLVCLFALCGCATATPAPSTCPEQPVQVSGPAAEPGPEPSGKDGDVRVIDIQDYQGKLHAVDVEVAGEKILFVFDTGAGLTVVSPSIARKLGCEPSGRLVGFRMSGERLDFPRCEDVVLELASVPIAHEMVGVFDLMALLPEGWTPLGGLVGLTSFEDQPFTLDLAGGEVRLETNASLRERTADLEPVDIQLVKQASGFSTVVLLKSPTEHGDLWLELDSGSTAPIILAPHAARALGVDLEDETQATHVPAEAGRPEMWKVEKVTVDLGPLGVVETPAVVRDIIYDANVGAPLMKRFQWTFDLEGGRVWARPVDAAAKLPGT